MDAVETMEYEKETEAVECCGKIYEVSMRTARRTNRMRFYSYG